MGDRGSAVRVFGPNGSPVVFHGVQRPREGPGPQDEHRAKTERFPLGAPPKRRRHLLLIYDANDESDRSEEMMGTSLLLKIFLLSVIFFIFS